jgi:hypothetical protein
MTTTLGPTWADFETSAPDLAAAGRRCLDRHGTVQALLATVAGDGLPRIHPIWLAIREGRLFAFINPSAKQADLATDGRYALHSLTAPTDLDEFSIRGRAREIADLDERAAIAAGWYFNPGPDYRLFEFSIAAALHGTRADADAWPPRYTSWRPDRVAAGVAR